MFCTRVCYFVKNIVNAATFIIICDHIYLPLFLIIILLTKLDYCVSLYFTEVVLSITSLKVAWKLAFRICFFQKQQMLDGFSCFSFDSLPFLPR